MSEDSISLVAVVELPLVAAQPGIWFADQLSQQKNMFTVAHYIELAGPLERELFSRAVSQGVAEADTLHARFFDGNDGPMQRIPLQCHAADMPELAWLDLSSHADGRQVALTLMRDDTDAPLPVDGEEPLYRHWVIRVPDENGKPLWLWYQRYHHLLLDGFSFTAITRRIADIYTALLQGKSIGESPFTRFSEVVSEYLAYVGSETEQRDKQFWQQHTADLPAALSLAPINSPVRAEPTDNRVLRQRINIDSDLFSGLTAGGAEHRLSATDMAMALLLIYFARMSGEMRLSVGCPFMRRMGSAALTATGPVVNVLPLQVTLRREMHIVDVARAVASELKTVRKHQRYEAEQLRRDLGMVGSQRALYGPVLNFKMFDFALNFGEITGVTHTLASGPVDDVEFDFYLDNGQLTLEMLANAQRYDLACLHQHGERIQFLLQQLATQAEITVGDLILTPEQELQRIDSWAKGPQLSLPAGVVSVLDIFQQQVTLQPDAIAVSCGKQSLTYRQLADRVAQLGRTLIARGIGADDVVAIGIPRTVDSLVAILGVLTSGAAYMPLDLDYPMERLALMCEDASPRLLLAHQSTESLLSPLAINGGVAIVCLNESRFQQECAACSAQPITDTERRYPLHGDHLAYMIYTSGSTGRPKGVMSTHGGLVNLLMAHRTHLYGPAMAEFKQHNTRRMRAGHTASFSFDSSWEPLFWMMMGCEMVIFDEEMRRDAYALVQMMDQTPIDTMDITPSFLTQMIESGLLDAGRHRPAFMMIGGEAATPRLWEQLKQHPEMNVVNFYGPSEYTIDTLGANTKVAAQPVIGRPVANTEVYLLDNQLTKVPIGAVGELYIAGKGLARGYLNRPDLTAARFVANPFRHGEVMYRSGDLMRWTAEGQLDFVGRTDHQIKVRGFRVELGEVENALVALPEVSSAVVIAEAIGATHRLIGYCTVPDAQQRDSEDLNARLMDQLAVTLPDYMVPAILMVLDEMPLTVNGKIDRQALPAPQHQQQLSSRAPQTAQETLLCDSIANLLRVGNIGAEDDFFQLGGDSISAMALGSTLRRAGFRLAPREIFALRTPAKMALALQPLVDSPVAAHSAATAALPETLWQAAGEKYGPIADILPVLPLQQGLLFHAQLGQEANNYNAISRFDLQGALDIECLRDALENLLRRYPQLGAIFDSELHSESLQILPQTQDSARRWPWQQYDLSALTRDQQIAKTQQLERKGLARDLMSETAGTLKPLLMATLIRYSAERHSLIIIAHHLVGDGWSSAILLHDLLHLYGNMSELPPLSVSYGDLIRRMTARDLQPDRLAWQQAIRGVVPTILYPEAHAAGPVHEWVIALDSKLEAALTELQRREGITLNTLLQGAWATLLGVLSGRDDVVFGSPVSGRFSEIEGIEQQVGLFSNTLPVRVKLQPQLPLLAQLAALQQQQIQLLEHDGLGLGEIQRLAGANTLFDTLLVVENYPENNQLHQQSFNGLRCDALNNRGYTHYPLTLLVLPGEKLHLQLEYRDAVSDPQRLAQRLVMLLEYLVWQPELPLSALNLLTADEKALLAAANDTAVALPALTLCDLMNQQSQLTPQAIALLDADETLTYQQVNQRVKLLAAHLRQQGVQPGDRVAVALPRSVNLSLALMAILAAGAAYLPLDTGYPDDRLAYMISDANPRLLMTVSSLAERFTGQAPLLLLDQLSVQDQPALLPAVQITPDHPAYLIYTSGSTGRPKGVVVSHGAIVNRLLWMQNEYPLGGDDVVLQKTPCSFDVSVWEFFWPMITGARLVMAPPEAHRDPEVLRSLIEDYGVTTAHFVPSMLAAFVSAMQGQHQPCQSLRRVFCSGEALSRELSELYQQIFAAPLHNLYGPTEAAVDVTYQPAYGDALARVTGSSVPIGKPVWNTQLRILDSMLRQAPVGIAGDLYLCGVQLAQGYHARPDLTASRFVADPYDRGQRMYRTGDIARWLPDGTVEYLGRSDDQLKIRGQRIELGEIESALLELPSVQQAVVHARSLAGAEGALAGADTRQLVGYIVPVTGAENIDLEALRSQLSERLPAHMVPVVIVSLSALPLSANGKLDRKALPAPVNQAGRGGRAPQAGLESLIAGLFAHLLGVESVSADDDFFALGGHSLLAMRLAADLRRELQQPVAVGQVMVASTVAALAAALSQPQSDKQAGKAGFSEVLPLRNGSGNPLFCFHPASGFAWQFSLLPRYLPGSWPVLGIQSPRPHGAIATCQDMDSLCDHHLATLRRVQPQGPYHLMGYSLGGTVAQAMAVKLQAQGEEVAFLGLLDTYPPETQDWNAPIEAEALEEVERERALFMAAAGDEQEEKREMFAQIQANYDDSVGLLSGAKTPVYEGETTLFVATQTLPAGETPEDIWRPYVKQLRTYHLDCSHITMMSPETLKVLGPILQKVFSGIGSL
ncbi:non-ribosomal peptide synthetase [Yersinia kristensenii]|uniref:non-ribosomal peptide synthetase n=1 Tax=Yersinia kristensenii TaxID=28152 RepID=UPI0005E07285|nr:non-ribosomal peptide synthetase [Yersinia kristensenii]CNG86833.1 nonribosomal peptide synthetase [Yersinia kristensenii]CNK20807.1 nonribosomal peptide synthetase [Yersinia kristensenii]